VRKVGRAKRNTLPQSELHDLEHHQLGVFSILVSVMEFSERPLRGDLFAFIRADTALMAAIGTKRLPLSGHGVHHAECPLLGVKQTSFPQRRMSAYDPKRTSAKPLPEGMSAPF